MRFALPIVACLVAAALLGGCGSSKKSSSASTTATTATSTSSGGAAGKTVAVNMKNIQYAPKTVTVKVGQTVVWTNGDSVQHNVIAQTGASFKSALLNSGQTYKFKPTKPGTISYVCTIHPGMNGTIIVAR